MKKAEIQSIPVLYRLKVLLPLFLLMTAAGCILAERNFTGLFSAGVFLSPYGLLLFVGIPFLLIAFSFVLLYRLYDDASSSFKKSAARRRIYIYFLAAGILAMLPPAAVSAGFLISFSSAVNENLAEENASAAADIATAYYDGHIETIERVARDFMNPRIIQLYKNRPADLWPQILAEDPSGICYQVFQIKDGNYDEQAPLFEMGDSHCFLEKSPLTVFYNGLLPRSPETESGLIRYVTTGYFRDELFVCIYTSSFIPGYDRAVERISSDYTRVLSQKKLGGTYAGLSLTLYALCLLPSLLLFILISYIAGTAAGAPVSIFQDYLNRSLAGDRSRYLFASRGAAAGMADLLKKTANRIDMPLSCAEERFSLNDILVLVREKWQHIRPGQSLRLRFCQPEWYIVLSRDAAAALVSKLLAYAAMEGPPGCAVSASVRNIERGTLPCCRLIVCRSARPGGSRDNSTGGDKELKEITEAAAASLCYFYADKNSGNGTPASFFIDFPAVTG